MNHWLIQNSYAALMYDEIEEYEAAIAFLTGELSQRPTNTDAWNNRGVAQLEIGRQEQGLNDLRKAVEVDPENETALLNLGKELTRLGDGDAAIEAFAQALQITEDELKVLKCRAESLKWFERYEEAIAHLSRAIELQPNLGATYFARANLYLSLKKNDLATADFESAKKLGYDPYTW